MRVAALVPETGTDGVVELRGSHTRIDQFVEVDLDDATRPDTVGEF